MKKPIIALVAISLALFLSACVATDPIGGVSSVQITGTGVTGSGASKEITVKVGEPVILGLAIEKTGSPDLTESWTSSNASVVFVLPDSGAVWGLAENSAGVPVTVTVGGQSDTILVKVETGNYYTKEYIAANTIMVSDELAPNVKNGAGGLPDHALGFDIQISFPNPVVIDPNVMIWGYWIDMANGSHGIKKTVISQVISSNTLTINCMVQDFADLPYDKGVAGGNWASRKLFLNYIVQNF